jgi:hypothetical protein
MLVALLRNPSEFLLGKVSAECKAADVVDERLRITNRLERGVFTQSLLERLNEGVACVDSFVSTEKICM